MSFDEKVVSTGTYAIHWLSWLFSSSPNEIETFSTKFLSVPMSIFSQLITSSRFSIFLSATNVYDFSVFFFVQKFFRRRSPIFVTPIFMVWKTDTFCCRDLAVKLFLEFMQAVHLSTVSSIYPFMPSHTKSFSLEAFCWFRVDRSVLSLELVPANFSVR